MSLKKLRDGLIEVKLYFVRSATYLNIFNFLMIALIFLNTTLWEYDFIQNIFPNKKLFLIMGFIFLMVIIALIGHFDTKLKLWRTESERSLSPDRNPLLVPIAFQCAKMLNDLKKQNKDTKEIETNLDEIFKNCNLNKEFEVFKKYTE